MTETDTDHTPFTHRGIRLDQLTSEQVSAMEPRERMEILDALNAHIITKGGSNVISEDEQRGALILVRAQRVQGVRNNPRASKAAKEAAAQPIASLDDFQ